MRAMQSARAQMAHSFVMARVSMELSRKVPSDAYIEIRFWSILRRLYKWLGTFTVQNVDDKVVHVELMVTSSNYTGQGKGIDTD